MRRAFVLLSLLLCACMGGRPPPSGALLVFAPEALRPALTGVAAGFEKSMPGSRVVFNFAEARRLVEQIGADAPADVLALDNAGMDAAVATQRVPSIDVHVFARGASAVYSAAPLVDAGSPELAHAFVAYLLGPEGQAVLAGQGLAAP